jgi:hypothetical protein
MATKTFSICVFAQAAQHPRSQIVRKNAISVPLANPAIGNVHVIENGTIDPFEGVERCSSLGANHPLNRLYGRSLVRNPRVHDLC